MENTKNALTLLGAGIAIGVILAVILISILGARPSGVNVGGIEFDIPTATVTSIPATLTPASELVQPPISTIIPSPTISPTLSGLHICGEPAFSNGLQTTDPLFFRPDGYYSGWISSDPSNVTFPNGATLAINTQYVMVVENLPFIQVQGVQRQAGKANTWGCWYTADLSQYVLEDAMTDFCIKKANNNVAVFYKATESGYEQIGTTATISCP
jgi:hypothetical protein